MIAIFVPYRPCGCPHRARAWEYVQRWLRRHHSRYPVFVGDNDGEFRRGAARNHAARQAGDWSVGIFWDADTVAHPDAVEEAIDTAILTGRMVAAGDAFIYASPGSTNRILSGNDLGLVRPVSFDDRGVYARPCSGVVVVPRGLYEAVGGWIEGFSGWGYEDLVFLSSCGIFGPGNTWVPDHVMVHLWHPPSEVDARTEANERVWRRLVELREDPEAAREYLAGLGHAVPPTSARQ